MTGTPSSPYAKHDKLMLAPIHSWNSRYLNLSSNEVLRDRRAKTDQIIVRITSQSFQC